MPKLHDLCQQFWEEISAAEAAGGTTRSVEEVVDIAYERLKAVTPRDADILKRHLLSIAQELQVESVQFDEVEQLTDGLFG